jgi:hypothetical protein
MSDVDWMLALEDAKAKCEAWEKIARKLARALKNADVNPAAYDKKAAALLSYERLCAKKS